MGDNAAAAAWAVPLLWAWPCWMRRWACRVWGHVFQEAKAIPPPPGLGGRLGDTLQKDTPEKHTKKKKFKKDTPKKTTQKYTVNSHSTYVKTLRHTWGGGERGSLL